MFFARDEGDMLFPPDFLKQLEYLSIISKRVFRGRLLAQRRTRQLGAGIEFSDHREYSAGDDFRSLDWNVYARHGDLLLKRYEEEQDLHVYLMLDCSRSMGFGEGAKFDLARRLVAALAYVALADLDRVAVFAFAENILVEFPLCRGKARILPLLRFLEDVPVSGSDTNLRRAGQDLLARTKRTGLAIVVSDLFDRQGFDQGLDLLRFRQFDVNVIQIHDPREADPRLLGDVELVDIESDDIRQVTVTEKLMRNYRELFLGHQRNVKDYCRRHVFGCIQEPSTESFDQVMLRMMRATTQVA
jgi:uncharacterized protein (DUF58 family)